MKLNIRTEGLFEKPEYDDGGNEIGSQELVYALPSTRFNRRKFRSQTSDNMER